MSSSLRKWPEDVLPQLAAGAARRPVVILDDDPTGTQTLRDVTVLTSWDSGVLAAHLDEPAVFLSTNSRALVQHDAVAVTHDAAVTARGASRARGRPLSIVSRSDSTLRGHFPAEPAAIADALGTPDARLLVAPYFGEGGRVTVGDAHYLERGGARVPVGETEYAADPVFGYRASNLRDWVAEKYAAAGLGSPAMTSLSLELVRGGGPEAVADAIVRLPAGGVAVVNAEVDRDIEVVALGSLIAEEAGVAVVARTAASYVRARAGRSPMPLLTAADLQTDGPGLIVVGSHVDTTTRQLRRLLDAEGDRISVEELAVDRLTAGETEASAAIDRVAATLDAALGSGRIGLVATERTRREVDLAGGRAISDALVAIVERVEHRPAWVIAKGGITSSDVASRALWMREARVAGQILPGVPVWVGGEETRWPSMPLVVFPGNVGDDGSLLRAVEKLVGT